ncbi:MAG: DUF2889 domain-containing protein [Thermodesulfobacteriota bacterium]|nr:DUF2889 domain-containing protein [Thermodesulfobacteriota bacterium]
MNTSTFCRSKLVGIECVDKDTFLAHGILDDYIYSLELDVEVKLPELKIAQIKGMWKRYTTSECPKAIPKLQNAVGLSILDQDFRRTVNRVIWREGCEHFANLLLECCDALTWVILYGEWQELVEKGSIPNKHDYLKKKLEIIPGLQDHCILCSRKGE